MKPDDPEARLPPGEPEGSVPLPAGAATMTTEALVRYAVLFGAVVLAVGVLSIAIGRPVFSRIATPTPVPHPSAPPAPASPAPSR